MLLSFSFISMTRHIIFEETQQMYSVKTFQSSAFKCTDAGITRPNEALWCKRLCFNV